MKKISISVLNMDCAACAQNIERKLKKTDGVVKAGVNLLTNKATVEYDEKKITEDRIKEIIKSLGYGTV